MISQTIKGYIRIRIKKDKSSSILIYGDELTIKRYKTFISFTLKDRGVINTFMDCNKFLRREKLTFEIKQEELV